MKNFTLVMFMILFSSSCFAQKLKTFVHPTDGYEIGIPKKWRIKEHNNLSLLVFGPKYNKYYTKDGSIMINIQKVVNVQSDVLYKDYIRMLRESKKIVEIGEESKWESL